MRVKLLSQNKEKILLQTGWPLIRRADLMTLNFTICTKIADAICQQILPEGHHHKLCFPLLLPFTQGGWTLYRFIRKIHFFVQLVCKFKNLTLD